MSMFSEASYDPPLSTHHALRVALSAGLLHRICLRAVAGGHDTHSGELREAMNDNPDVYNVTIQHVAIAASTIGFDVLRKPGYYIILTDALPGYGDAVKFPDSPHGYTEAQACIRKIAGDEEANPEQAV